jgi:hypothetical protein
VDSLFDRIALTIPQVKEMTGTSYGAAKNNVQKLVKYGILKELSYPANLSFLNRPKFFFATDLMELFEH